jgi:hypothetical protein
MITLKSPALSYDSVNREVARRVIACLEWLHLLDAVESENPDIVGTLVASHRVPHPAGEHDSVRADHPRGGLLVGGLEVGEPHLSMVAERFSKFAKVLEVSSRGERRRPEIAGDLLVG